MTSVKEIACIDQKAAEKLIEYGIRTTEQLLETCGSKHGRMHLADETHIDEEKILSWVNCVDLLRLDGVGEEYAGLLAASGASTVPKLAYLNPVRLHERMQELNSKKHLAKRLPGVEELESMIHQAKILPKLVRH